MTDSLAKPAQILRSPESTEKMGLYGWTIEQLQNLLMIFMVISVLLFTLKILKLLGIEKLMAIILMLFLRLLGISPKPLTSLLLAQL